MANNKPSTKTNKNGPAVEVNDGIVPEVKAEIEADSITKEVNALSEKIQTLADEKSPREVSVTVEEIVSKLGRVADLTKFLDMVFNPKKYEKKAN